MEEDLLDRLINNFGECTSLELNENTSEILEFIEEMSSARHSGFITDERLQRYRGLDIDGVISTLENIQDPRNKTRAKIVISSIESLPSRSIFSSGDNYF